MSKLLATGLERSFGVGRDVVHALGPVDLEVAEGEFVCVVGPSGCGKSTLLRIIAGLLNPSSGQLDLQWRDKNRPLVSVVFQDYSIFPWKTVEANVRFGLDMAGEPKASSKAKAEQWLRKLGLIDFKRSYPSTLSGGMRQRVSIARALAMEPEILLMDEPFAALDAQLRTVMQDELLALWQEHQRTVVFITHSIDEAILLGDRILVMSARPGTILAEYTVPFERPRDASIRGTAEFAALEQQIWGQLRGEVDRVLGTGAVRDGGTAA